ncbi:ABC transporter ATP-binding protein [Pyxidicoccus fallax]|uniref:ABC transporter ATP-binding protein n=1 Tax=Pyxidicoccus fallax TaxID=394095 RepID=A0A848LIZ5_9BACT|nr:ABC transporter ATP-binding protein [Pyxidicoccus fallax]NMO17701.1 ABC transporter ATP-binding protein [Pyxidicoccus fallax]NPC80908.1 ABC transporter ATP-binding protein [Pyxidicoccus fallax]
MPLLSLDTVSLRYTSAGTPAVDGLSLAVEPGEVIALLGPSGCGKTTTLRLVAGFERPDTGTVTLEGRVLAGPSAFVPPEQRSVGMVFQDYALFPHLSVLDNVTFGLGALPRADAQARARSMLKLFGLEGFESRMPHALSGGQQQRVALARALAPGPRVLLLDEPFSSLDSALRVSTRGEVRRVLKSLGATVMLVTHDQGEAMAFADRLVVMRAGKVEQVGTPEAVYSTPRTAFVAYFLGGTNLLPGVGFGNGARTMLGILPVVGHAKGNVLLSLRPESLRLVPDTDTVAVGGALRAEVLTREFQGPSAEYTVACGGMELTVRGAPELPLGPGARARLEVVGRAVVLEDKPD